MKLRAWPSLARVVASWDRTLEVILLMAWAAWFGREYLDFSPLTWPVGGEFPMATQGNIVWSWLWRCGDCVLWNGSVRGGSPALIDLHSAVAHPLVIITTILWGSIVGAKVTLVICLFLGGLTQWWLAHILQLGRFARLWGAALGVVGGHLAARMQVGVFAVVLSTAFGSLAIVAAIALALDGRRRSAVRLAIILALTIMAGQGYIQLGLLVALLPAWAVLMVDENLSIRPVWREFAIAAGLGVLLSAFFLVPLAHFWPSIGKDVDATFSSAQPVAYGPLNLVINDVAFYLTEALGKQPYPYLYINYVGWLPILLAMASFRLIPRARTQLLLFFLLAIGLIYLASSAAPFRMLLPLAPGFMSGVRNPGLIAGLAVPLILGLAAWGLDGLLRIKGPAIVLSLRGASARPIPIMGLLILVSLWAIWPVYRFNQQWLSVTRVDPVTQHALDYLSVKPASQWVQSPYGDGIWLPQLLERGAKIASVTRPWSWVGHEDPQWSREVTRYAEAKGVVDEKYYDLLLITHPDVLYAAVTSAEGVTPCTAKALGGHIDVECDAPKPGELLVYEHAEGGWGVTVDGQPGQLTDSPWLALPSEAGHHRYQFRYRPWDVPVGALLTLVGLLASWWYASSARATPGAQQLSEAR